jgi:cyclopropane fatty-acyl-phospholipid synthase-like methyltransferase
MSTIAPSLGAQRTSPTVVRCYDLLDAAVSAGFHDFTDGRYVDGQTRGRAAYLAAQEAQAEYLLDQVGCRAGSRILDIGCGYGRVLEHAARRGAAAIGITISPPQVARCGRRGLDVRLLNYRDMGHAWAGQFDGIIANGSLEHFVQVADAAAGQSDAIYEEMFAICRRLLEPGKRLATTAIHFRTAGRWRAEEFLADAPPHRPGSDGYCFASVCRNFGGWYPEQGQLERCAAASFRLTSAEDGTCDYRRTSEYWLRLSKAALLRRPRFWLHLAKLWRQQPERTKDMLRCLLWDQSWLWQFRGYPPPMILWRHTWEAV